MVIDFLLDKKNWVKPKKIAGFREMISVAGVGKFVGKLDTGNGATSCSLHADSIEEMDGHVHWELGGKEFVNKIVGQSRAEVGTRVHKRAVINLDIEFNKIIYKNVKFSLVDRSEKSTPVLLNRDFLTSAGIIVDSSEDFIMTQKPADYSPRTAKGDPFAGVQINLNDKFGK